MKEITPTDSLKEKEMGRIALWLEPSDLEWLSQHCPCGKDATDAEIERCGRIRFRASAALHKAGIRD